MIKTPARKITEPLFLLALLFPLLFININSFFDWGDDFAQYINQAKQILAGQSQNETGYIYNPRNFIGPQAYPAGFPLLLSSVMAFTQNIESLNVFMSLLLVLTGLMAYFIIRPHSSYFTTVFIVLIVLYNPYIVNFKTEVLSDIPFTLFALLSLYLITKKPTLFLTLLTGFLIGFSIHIRSIGFVLLLVYILNQLIQNGFSLQKHRSSLTALVSAGLVYALVKLIFPCHTNYPSLLYTDGLWMNINRNFSYNLEMLQLFFRNDGSKSFAYIGIITSSCLIGFSLAGLIYSVKKRLHTVYVLYFLLYGLVILFFPFSNAGIRFILPVLFVMFLFAIIGMQNMAATLPLKTTVLPFIFGLCILFSYKKEVWDIITRERYATEGPQTPFAQTVFRHIDQSLPPNAVVAFDKPRALALYTQVKSFAFSEKESYSQIKKDIRDHQIQYVLVYEPLASANVKQYVADTANCSLRYSRHLFSLYQIKK